MAKNAECLSSCVMITKPLRVTIYISHNIHTWPRMFEFMCYAYHYKTLRVTINPVIPIS